MFFNAQNLLIQILNFRFDSSSFALNMFEKYFSSITENDSSMNSKAMSSSYTIQKRFRNLLSELILDSAHKLAHLRVGALPDDEWKCI